MLKSPEICFGHWKGTLIWYIVCSKIQHVVVCRVHVIHVYHMLINSSGCKKTDAEFLNWWSDSCLNFCLTRYTQMCPGGCRTWHSCRKQLSVWLVSASRVKLTRKLSVVWSTWHDLLPLFGRRILCSLPRSTLCPQYQVCEQYLTLYYSLLSSSHPVDIWAMMFV